jgi:hypothetical protein
MNDSLLDRCAAAYEDAILSQYNHRQAIAAVLEHVAAEMVVMNQRDAQLTVHQVVQYLRLEAAGELAGWEAE